MKKVLMLLAFSMAFAISNATNSPVTPAYGFNGPTLLQTSGVKEKFEIKSQKQGMESISQFRENNKIEAGKIDLATSAKRNVATRAEEAYCEMGGKIFTEGAQRFEFVPMELQSDGCFILKPGPTYSGEFYFIYNPGNNQGSQILYSKEYKIPLGEPVECTFNGNYYFGVPRGDYTFLFDPSTMMLTVTGEVLPTEYYLAGSFNDYINGDSKYKFQSSSDDNGNYSLKYEGALTSGFLINTGSLYEYYASDDENYILEIDTEYHTTLTGEYYIQLPSGMEIKNPDITFNPATKELLVKGSYQKTEVVYALNSFMYGEDQNIWPMTEQENGLWILDNGLHAVSSDFDIVKINPATNQILDVYFWNDWRGDIILDEPMQCVTPNGYLFYNRPGYYSFTFNPEDLTLIVSGKMDPPTYFIENSMTGESYSLVESEENSGIFTVDNIPFFPSGYLVSSSYYEYYGSNGQELVPGQPYATMPGFDYIQTQGDLNFINCTITFNGETKELTITGETAESDIRYGIYGSIFSEDEESVSYLPLELIGNIYSNQEICQVYSGWFNIIKYDNKSNYIYSSIGPEFDQTTAKTGEVYRCYQMPSVFNLTEGNYYFHFNDFDYTVVLTSEDTQNKLFVSPTYQFNGTDMALVELSIFTLDVPENATYTAYYKNSEETEFTVMPIESLVFMLNISDLMPDTTYNYEIYVKAEADGETYLSDISNFVVRTSPILFWFNLNYEGMEENNVIFSYQMETNIQQEVAYGLEYAAVPGSVIPSVEAAENAEYISVPLDFDSGYYTVEGLEPNTEYVIYIYFTCTLKNRIYKSDLGWILATTLTSGVENLPTENLIDGYYNLSGQRVSNPANGLFIEVKDGKTRKFIIK